MQQKRVTGRGKGYVIQTARRVLLELVIRDIKTRVSQTVWLFWVGVGKRFWMQEMAKPLVCPRKLASDSGGIENAEPATQTQKPLHKQGTAVSPPSAWERKPLVSNCDISQRGNPASHHPVQGHYLVMMARKLP